MKRLSLLPFLLSAVLAFADTSVDQPTTPTATLELTADSPNTSTGGGTLTFTASAADYPADTTAIAWAVTIPAGWTYAGGDNEPSITPTRGDLVLLEWAYINIPDTDAVFTFSVDYPADILDESTITAEVIVRAASASDYAVLDVDPLSFDPAPYLDQPISFPAIATKRANDASFQLSATSPSGLPITYTVVSGPALISGNTVTLTGATGTVVIRANQGGDLYYKPATTATQSFEVVQSGSLVYFGQSSDGTEFAAEIPAGDKAGTVLGFIESIGQYYILTFRVAADDSIIVVDLQIVDNPVIDATTLAQYSLRRRAAGDEPAADEHTYTFTGTLNGSVLNLQIAELGITMTAQVEPAEGPTANLAGLYEASSLNSANGTTSSIVGTTGKVYVLAVTPTIVTGGSGTIASAGTFDFSTNESLRIVGNVDAPSTSVTGTLVFSDGSEDPFAGLSTETVRTDRMINLSTRAYVNGSPLITGFVIGGDQPKRVLLRAVGPTLADYGIDNPVADPRITLFDAAGSELMSSDTWSDDANAAMAATVTGAFPLPEGSLDAALVTELAPGVYTLHVNHTGAGGIAIAEIYDAAENPNSEYQRLVNISSRGDVTGGEGVLIGGFIVTGNSPKRVLVRGIGPGLAAQGVSGVLMDPQVKVYNADRQVVAANDNWQTATPVFAGQRTATATEITTANSTLGAFALADGASDAGLIVTLAPGAYTVELSASAATTDAQGNALIEIYELPE
ncbi:hypothetical protein [Actomonas aquatica]|uniref:DUF4382 domain-containing protein n=1 Tax=Actomonas aquatica TaxID=2866162 RepID=A0ABZ1CBQ4_9BACT|nr:hypothetical protein [Opitutus sp. WL0086]WRQ88673.1 hypothetical protein K1X11_004605 [Opitutus sp. WL0086]